MHTLLRGLGKQALSLALNVDTMQSVPEGGYLNALSPTPDLILGTTRKPKPTKRGQNVFTNI